MSASVFEFESYKVYLKERLAGKGEKAAFAKRIGCQASFLSQVLCGQPSLSLEQGVTANETLNHTRAEGRHFLALLQFERAGSERLRQYFKDELTVSLQEHRKVKERVGPARELSTAARTIYYSSWIYSAIHVLASIPTPQGQHDFLCRHTGLKPDELEGILEFLIKHGLLTMSAGRISPAETRIHLPSHDPLVLSHHRNFRARALQEMQVRNEKNLHYSLLMAIAKTDGVRIRDMILKFIESTDKVIRPSKEESAFQLNLDFFEI